MSIKELTLQVLQAKQQIKPTLKQGEKPAKVGLKIIAKKHTTLAVADDRFNRPSLETLRRIGWTEKDLFCETMPIGLTRLPQWHDRPETSCQSKPGADRPNIEGQETKPGDDIDEQDNSGGRPGPIINRNNTKGRFRQSRQERQSIS